MSDFNIYENMSSAEAYKFDAENAGRKFTKRLIAEYIITAEKLKNMHYERIGETKYICKVAKLSTLMHYSKDFLIEVLENVEYFRNDGITFGTFVACYDIIQGYDLECCCCVKFGQCVGACHPASGLCPGFKEIEIVTDIDY